MKKIIWILVIIILLAAGYFYFSGDKTSINQKSNMQTEDKMAEVVSDNSSNNSLADQDQTKASITLEEIAKHNTKTDCWTTIEGKVYNMTSFIPNHPGGDKILVVCGVDGTEAFMNQHDNGQKQLDILKGLYVGDLAK